MAAINTGKLKPGFKASIYEGRFTSIPDFNTLKPVQEKTVPGVFFYVADRNSYFGIVFTGYIFIPDDGVYGLFINSDDGSKIVLDDIEKVMNDGIHGMREEGNYYPLAKGYHKIRIEYFQGEGGVGLEFLIEAPGQKKLVVPSSWLFN